MIKMRRAVGAIIEHHKYGILLQLRDDKTTKYPLHWSLFGGRVEDGENDDEALYRELEEELLLTKDNIIEFRQIGSYSFEDLNQTLYYIRIELNPEELVLNEGKDMMFVEDLNEVLYKLPFAFNIKEVLIDYLKSSSGS